MDGQEVEDKRSFDTHGDSTAGGNIETYDSPDSKAPQTRRVIVVCVFSVCAECA